MGQFLSGGGVAAMRLSSLLLCAPLLLAGCTSLGFGSKPVSVSGFSKDAGVQVSQRAVPTSGGGAVTNAHYEHVYVDPNWGGSKSLQTITLADAVKNDVLINNDLSAKPLSFGGDKPLKWIVFDSDFSRPSKKEAVGGAGIDEGLLSEVNFDLNEVEMINPEKLTALVERSRMIAGSFFIVGYTDRTGTELGNKKLAQLRAQAVAESLIDAGVHKSRVQYTGIGVSNNYPTDDLNRRASIVFVAD